MYSPYDDSDSSVESQILLMLGAVTVSIGAGLIFYCVIRLLRMYRSTTQSPVPNAGDIELGHQEVQLAPVLTGPPPVLRENFVFVHGENECNICLEEFEPNVVLANTLCGHAFHLDCLRIGFTNEAQQRVSKTNLKFKPKFEESLGSWVFISAPTCSTSTQATKRIHHAP
ncbi:BnaC02g44100D [Brassica napus]|uniref:BnaC02g44100D protein n=1 Tax=Brassica napus TaxID=3708 RepID=A0A078IIR4_BRANA|nr:BnaC02g44100D [Brassica napus]